MPNKHYSKIKDDHERAAAERLAEDTGIDDLTTNDIDHLLKTHYPDDPEEQREAILSNREKRGGR